MQINATAELEAESGKLRREQHLIGCHCSSVLGHIELRAVSRCVRFSPLCWSFGLLTR